MITQALLQSAEAQIKYTVTRLVPISGVFSQATALNAQGDVVGTYTWRDGTQHVFLNHAGIMHDIAALAGSNPTGINIYGRIVGNSLPHVGGYTYFEKKAWPVSGHIDGLVLNLLPVAVNTASHIACYINSDPFIWQKSGITALPLGFFPTAINNREQVAGYAQDQEGGLHAILISGGQEIDLGSLLKDQRGFNYVYALNDQGQVVGESPAPGGASHAFLYSGGSMQDIHTIGPSYNSAALGINNSEQVVGEFTDTQFIATHPFIYDGSKMIGSQMIDLNSLIDPSAGWLVDIPWSINDAGQIIARGYFQNEGLEACLLTPVQ